MNQARRRCPICQSPIDPEQMNWGPFCSARCQQIDLGRWLNESYGLPVQRSEDEDEEQVEEPADRPPEGGNGQHE